uniref:Odorant receptor n=1 Tax=Glyphodes pyloalis TaxID=1242752 RepID=A0A6M3GU67_GLYPY|nr:olfactory receptor [Glyphodes pyloalis]
MDLTLEHDYQDEEVPRFEPFHKTYKWISGCLTVCLMYPNPSKWKIKLALIFTLIILTSPFVIVVTIDMWIRLMSREISELLKHSTTLGPFLGALVKKVHMVYMEKRNKALLDELEEDYETYNRLPKRYQATADAYRRQALWLFETVWAYTLIFVNTVFISIPVSSTIYSYVVDDIPTRYMLHDVVMPMTEQEYRLTSPCYEIFFVISALMELVIMLNYTSYEGLFGILTNHACLKMHISCMYLQDAFKEDTEEGMRRGIVKFLDEQNKCYKYNSSIQISYSLWMNCVLVCVMIQIGSMLYHVSAGATFDLRYALFCLSCVVEIFLPCRIAADLKKTSTDTATLIYCSGWERVRSVRVRRVVPHLIARAQLPELLVAFQLLAYDMELFVRIMKTSYTVFTLLETN